MVMPGSNKINLDLEITNELFTLKIPILHPLTSFIFKDTKVGIMAKSKILNNTKKI